MTATKELADKIKTYQKLQAQTISLFNEIEEELIKLSPENEYVSINDFDVYSEPAGEDQGSGEYCDQYSGPLEDDYHGTYFYPIEGSDEYIGMSYSC